MSVLLGLTLAACSGGNEAKVVSHHINNGHGNGPGIIQKPTPETGVNVTGFSALALIGVKEATRALDIALKGKESTRIEQGCQEVLPTKSANVTSINIKTRGIRCSAYSADETFQVTYDNNNKIEKIEKNEISNDRGIIILNKSSISDTSNEINLHESLKIERIGNSNIYNLNSAVNVFMDVSNSGGGNRPTETLKKSISFITLTGKIDLSNTDSPQLQITSLKVNYLRRMGKKPTDLKDKIATQLTIIQISGQEIALSECGTPTGTFSVQQDDGVDLNKQTPYNNVALTINGLTGQLSVPKAKDQITLKKCGVSFIDIANVVNVAERIVERVPGRSGVQQPNAGGGSGGKSVANSTDNSDGRQQTPATTNEGT